MKWSYKVIEIAVKNFQHEDDLTDFLNKYGIESWELVSHTTYKDRILGESYRFIFKRNL